MATKNKSKQILKMKYLLVLPVLLLMLMYVNAYSQNKEKDTRKEDKILEIKKYIKEKRNQNSDSNKKNIIEIEHDDLIYHITEDKQNIKDELKKVDTYKIIYSNNDTIVPPKPPTPPKPEISNVIEKQEFEEIVPFTVIDKVPVYPSCKNLKTNSERSNCFNEKIKKHVTKNFNIKLAQNLELSAGRKKINVQFEINKNGVIENIMAKAPHPELQKEAIRIIKLLPQIQAGEQDGKKVSVRYNLPIIFNIEKENKKINNN